MQRLCNGLVSVAKPTSLRRDGPIPVPLPPKASRPGRLVAATACPGRHETPGTVVPRRDGPKPSAVHDRSGPNPRRSATADSAAVTDALLTHLRGALAG